MHEPAGPQHGQARVVLAKGAKSGLFPSATDSCVLPFDPHDTPRAAHVMDVIAINNWRIAPELTGLLERRFLEYAVPEYAVEAQDTWSWL